MATQRQIAVTVRDREKVIYEGQVLSVSGLNDVGPFDVLPSHENFITLLKGEIVIREMDGRQTKLPVVEGVMKVMANRVEVFMGIKR